MKYFPLVLAGLWRKPARTIFTFLSIMIAFILFGLMSGVQGGLMHAMDTAKADRMFTDPRYGTPIPYTYAEKIARIPGVTLAVARSGVYGYYKDPKNGIGVIMADGRFFQARSELTPTKEEIAKMEATPSAVLASNYYIKKYGWKVGDKITLISDAPKADGSKNWTFYVVGFFEDSDNPGNEWLIGNYKYLDDQRVENKGTSGRILIRIKDPKRAAEIGRTIDKMFINSPAPTRTGSDKANMEANTKSLGDINFFITAVISAVIFMILFLTGNTMMQSVRERVPEFGVLKAMGYSDRTVLALVLAESLLLCTSAGLVGLVLTKSITPIVAANSESLAQILRMQWSSLFMGFAISLLVALAAGLWPALRVRRLNVIDALAGR